MKWRNKIRLTLRFNQVNEMQYVSEFVIKSWCILQLCDAIYIGLSLEDKFQMDIYPLHLMWNGSYIFLRICRTVRRRTCATTTCLMWCSVECSAGMTTHGPGGSIMMELLFPSIWTMMTSNDNSLMKLCCGILNLCLRSYRLHNYMVDLNIYINKKHTVIIYYIS